MDQCKDDDLERAKAAVQQASAEVKEAGVELEHAEHDLERAEAELEEVEAADRHRNVEVTVDRRPKCVEAGEYIVSAFKELVGVAADRELDILKGGALHPLEDNAKITIDGCEVFVSHARTGGSS
jgi:hypothetical protein